MRSASIIGILDIAAANALTAPALLVIPAVLKDNSPNRIIGANGSVSPPSRPMMPSFNAVNTLALGDDGKSFIAAAYAATAPAFAIMPAVLNSYSPNLFILSRGSSAPNNPAIAPPIAPTAAPIPDSPSAAPSAAMPLL